MIEHLRVWSSLRRPICTSHHGPPLPRRHDSRCTRRQQQQTMSHSTSGRARSGTHTSPSPWRRRGGHDQLLSGTQTKPSCFDLSVEPGPPPQPVPEEMLRTLARKLARGLISRAEYNDVSVSAPSPPRCATHTPQHVSPTSLYRLSPCSSPNSIINSLSLLQRALRCAQNSTHNKCFVVQPNMHRLSPSEVSSCLSPTVRSRQALHTHLVENGSSMLPAASAPTCLIARLYCAHLAPFCCFCCTAGAPANAPAAW